MARKWKVIKILTSIFLIIMLAWFGWYSYTLYQKKIEISKGIQEAGFETISPTDSSVLFDGKRYERDPSIKAFLCIGVDSSGDLEQRVTGDGGQADGVFVVAYDAARDRVKILMIPRDTMTPITLTDLSGNVLGKDVQHITLAYGYGDGRELSCQRMAEAVSELLGGLSIDGYLAMNVSMISQLNDLVGGVTVQIENSGMERRDPALIKGNKVKLDGKQADIFVRYRDVTIDNSALLRMTQQRQYIEGYMEAIQNQAAKDDQTIVRIMKMIEDHMITNLSKDQYLNIGKAVLYSDEKLGQDDILTIPGEGVVTNLFDEYHYDPDVTRQMVLDMFYREK